MCVLVSNCSLLFLSIWGDLKTVNLSIFVGKGIGPLTWAPVPLANMFGYINNLRSMSQGRAQYSMFFDHYAKVPQNVQDEVTKKMA